MFPTLPAECPVKWAGNLVKLQHAPCFFPPPGSKRSAIKDYDLCVSSHTEDICSQFLCTFVLGWGKGAGCTCGMGKGSESFPSNNDDNGACGNSEAPTGCLQAEFREIDQCAWFSALSVRWR